jgi:hypothetical protein
MRKAWQIILLAGLGLSPAVQAQSLMDIGQGVLKAAGQLQNGSGTAAGGGNPNLGAGLSNADIGAGLKEALRAGTERVTARLGKTDGFNLDPAVHIPLPESLKTAQTGLKLAGLDAPLNDLELRLNRAAEAATPQAKKIFFDALSNMTVEDARGILTGPKDSATQYFRRSMSAPLKTAMRPAVDRGISEAGVVGAYQAAAGSAGLGGLAAQGQTMLTDHVLDYALEGIFHYLAEEEAAIRTDPAKQTTSLLKKVFGG